MKLTSLILPFNKNMYTINIFMNLTSLYCFLMDVRPVIQAVHFECLIECDSICDILDLYLSYTF